MIQVVPDQMAVLQAALDQWGLEPQMDMMHEEMGELMVAINKLKRNHVADQHPYLESKICEEVADVIVCAAELACAFGIEEVQSTIDFKINRLRLERLSNWKDHPRDMGRGSSGDDLEDH